MFQEKKKLLLSDPARGEGISSKILTEVFVRLSNNRIVDELGESKYHGVSGGRS